MKYLKYFENNNHKTDSLNIIVDSYLETAIWTEDFDEEVKDKTIYDFSNNARNQAKAEIEWFLKNSVDMFGDSVFIDVSYTSIGHDIWLSRNGHGAGFFDRGYEDEISDFLMYLSHQLGEISLEVNNDKIDFIMDSEKYKDFDLEDYKRDKELKDRAKKYNV
jgi:hypothetical protein